MGRSAGRTASFELDAQLRVGACPLRGCVGTTGKTLEMNAFVICHQDRAYLESLLDLFHECISICCKAVHCEHSAVSPTEVRQRDGQMGGAEHFSKKSWTHSRKTLGA